MKRTLLPVLVLISVLFLVYGISAEEGAKPQIMKPTDGWILHVDAKKHIPKMPEMVVHHYCKNVSGGLVECQLYDSDKPDARLIGVEVIVDKETWKKFAKKERALWHYHKTEIPKVAATVPDVSAEEGAKILKGMDETYGKVSILWDLAKSGPTGRPVVSILH
jgi:hypothetical protein